MKTLRELLLKRHPTVGDKLDRMWTESLIPALGGGEAADRGVEAAHPGLWLATVSGLWSQALRPYRRVWAGFAAVWLLLLLVNVAQTRHSEMTGARPAILSPQVLAILQLPASLYNYAS
jgi:hypothetical protein